MGSPLFSIIIVNYNHGAFLEEAVLSVLNQACQDFELVIVDGGSTDKSVEIIRKYSDRIAWWCSEKDDGQSDAFNKGFSHARGLFGCWLNADDIMMPHVIKNVKSFIEMHPYAEWICGGSVFCDSDMKVVWCSRCQRNLSFLTRWISFISVNGPSSFFKLSKLHQIKGFNTQLHYTMDIDLWLRFYKANMRLHYLQMYFWGFRIHTHSKTSHKFMTNVSTSEFRNESCENLEKHGITNFKKIIIVRTCQIIRLLSCVYLLSYLDTKRYRGSSVYVIKEQK